MREVLVASIAATALLGLFPLVLRCYLIEQGHSQRWPRTVRILGTLVAILVAIGFCEAVLLLGTWLFKEK